jgi:hypothetical protein
MSRSFGVAVCAGAFVAGCTAFVPAAYADEGGVSFWLPGLYGSFAAVPQEQPGWSLATIYTHASATASGAAAAAGTAAALDPAATASATQTTRADSALVAIGYAFATPVLDGQLTIGTAGLVGQTSSTFQGSLLAGQAVIADAASGVGDLYPQAMLRWNSGVDNLMVYATGGVPTGTYNPARLSNIGIGHGAADVGGGYTYLDSRTGRELSIVAGVTYNFTNPDTQYRNGIDFHLDWAAAQFLSERFYVGGAGYFYDQLTADSGTGALFGSFKSRVAAVGPQAGYLFPIGNMQGYLSLKAFWEFDAANRPSGWNSWLTFAIAPGAAHETPPRR